MLSSGDYIVNTGSLSGGQLIATASGNITNGDSGDDRHQWLSLTSGGKIATKKKPPLLSNNQIAAAAIGDFLNEEQNQRQTHQLSVCRRQLTKTPAMCSTGLKRHHSVAYTGQRHIAGGSITSAISAKISKSADQWHAGAKQQWSYWHNQCITAHSYWLNQKMVI